MYESLHYSRYDYQKPPPPPKHTQTDHYLSGRLRNGQSPHKQYGISAICNPGNGNKTPEQNDYLLINLQEAVYTILTQLHNFTAWVKSQNYVHGTLLYMLIKNML